MLNNPLVSVLIITRDRPQSLKSCIDSILENSYKNIEIIVWDNGAKDTTKKGV